MDEILEVLKSNNSMYRCVKLSACGYKIDFSVNCISTDVISTIDIPFMHVFKKIEIKHVNSTGGNSYSELDYSLQKSTPNNFKMDLFRFIDCKQSDIYDEYEGFLHERCQYYLTTNSDNNTFLYISVYINYTGVQ